ncbi:MAG: DUF2007 domain-containing protein [Oceanicaulis sp.]|jgi:hypothetical protein|uniref:putative signal transducing protein n=1 Tax=Oceanicaulis TaxID=153232 RepID=UPI0003B2F6C0|nr:MULTISPECIES: DUF2007 domain-containing protein [Oceanicaulis]MAP49351.1 DUF2007 domain-containing protein [Oceanicaulis sp.]MBL4539927.1 DUF2007 domain-containing protein [Oceanicaulis sp.]VXC67141.1 conserved hypothetical protein [Oceanicaulis sp. 350]HCR65588.1 DUF2007 domain-containing protein [Oceanicaulis sp.]|tara:strand:- start:1171 stop:1392 length:222 start_codon:yes stop_codon:yes gene_type:complete
MIEVLATNDPVKLSFAQAILKEAGIEAVTLDEQTSSTFGGALPWIKRRILVREQDADRAKAMLIDALKDDAEQ